MRRVALALTAVLTTCGFALAQQQPKSPPEQLQCFEQLVGDWTCETTLEEDIPGLAEKGTKLVLRSSWQWILDKQALQASWSARPEGKPRVAGRGLITWDPAASQICWSQRELTRRLFARNDNL